MTFLSLLPNVYVTSNQQRRSKATNKIASLDSVVVEITMTSERDISSNDYNT